MGDKLMSDLFNPDHWFGALNLGVLFIAAGLLLSWVMRRLLQTILLHDRSDHIDQITVSFLNRLSILALWALLATAYAHVVPALNRLGTALLAGVSLASVVIGFAAQSTLSNLVAGISLVLYKPFRRGDRLQISAPVNGGIQSGIVEEVSLGFTVLRIDDGREVIIANSNMAQQTMIRLPASDVVADAAATGSAAAAQQVTPAPPGNTSPASPGNTSGS